MQLILENTDQIVEIARASGQRGIDCRLWQGRTSDGVEVHAYIVRVAVRTDEPREVHAAFEAALQVATTPRPDLRVIPLRMVI